MNAPAPAETLGQKRCRFTLMVASLLQYMKSQGYDAALNEVMRTQAQASANAASGAGISNSLHLVGLAADINLYKNGTYLSLSSDHLPFGIWWEAQGGSWGGRFSKPDGNHYSLMHNGVR